MYAEQIALLRIDEVGHLVHEAMTPRSSISEETMHSFLPPSLSMQQHVGSEAHHRSKRSDEQKRRQEPPITEEPPGVKKPVDPRSDEYFSQQSQDALPG